MIPSFVTLPWNGWEENLRKNSFIAAAFPTLLPAQSTTHCRQTSGPTRATRGIPERKYSTPPVDQTIVACEREKIQRKSRRLNRIFRFDRVFQLCRLSGGEVLFGGFALLTGKKALDKFRAVLHVHVRRGSKKGITNLSYATTLTSGDHLEVFLQT
jgi:hypothetical protein